VILEYELIQSLGLLYLSGGMHYYCGWECSYSRPIQCDNSVALLIEFSAEPWSERTNSTLRRGWHSTVF